MGQICRRSLFNTLAVSGMGVKKFTLAAVSPGVHRWTVAGAVVGVKRTTVETHATPTVCEMRTSPTVNVYHHIQLRSAIVLSKTESEFKSRFLLFKRLSKHVCWVNLSLCWKYWKETCWSNCISNFVLKNLPAVTHSSHEHLCTHLCIHVQVEAGVCRFSSCLLLPSFFFLNFSYL